MNISLIVYLKERKRLKRRLIFIKEKEKLHYDGEMGWEMVMGKALHLIFYGGSHLSVAAGPTTLQVNHLNSCGTVEHAIDLGVTSAVSIPPTCG